MTLHKTGWCAVLLALAWQSAQSSLAQPTKGSRPSSAKPGPSVRPPGGPKPSTPPTQLQGTVAPNGPTTLKPSWIPGGPTLPRPSTSFKGATPSQSSSRFRPATLAPKTGVRTEPNIPKQPKENPRLAQLERFLRLWLHARCAQPAPCLPAFGYYWLPPCLPPEPPPSAAPEPPKEPEPPEKPEISQPPTTLRKN